MMGVCPESEPAIVEQLGLDTTSIQPVVPGEEIDHTPHVPKEEEIADKTQEQTIAQPRRETLDLYKEFRPQLLRYLRSLHLQRDQAEEVIQETFLRLATELAHASPIENKGGWIIRVARNLAIDKLRKKETEDAHIAEIGSVDPETFVDPQAGPYEIYWKKERVKQMKAALSTLNPQQRQCFQLRVQGFIYKDIGNALGISEQRVAAVIRQVASRLAVVCR
jgi:RNA polymerase sigma-70 factor (ECF subfamily)